MSQCRFAHSVGAATFYCVLTAGHSDVSGHAFAIEGSEELARLGAQSALVQRLRSILQRLHDLVYVEPSMKPDDYHDAWMEARALLNELAPRDAAPATGEGT